MRTEEWRDVSGFEGLYQVSNLGRVMSLNYRKTGKPQIMSLSYDKDGYQTVCLSNKGKKKYAKIHRLVGEAFIPNPSGLPLINHKDENRENNCVDNLEWCDVKYNNNYGTRNEKVIQSLSKPVICVETGVVYMSATVAGKELGIDNSAIGKCCKGIYKTCGNYHWCYYEP